MMSPPHLHHRSVPSFKPSSLHILQQQSCPHLTAQSFFFLFFVFYVEVLPWSRLEGKLHSKNQTSRNTLHSLVLIVSKRNEIQNIFLVKYQDVLIFRLASQKEESCQDFNVQCGKSLRKPGISGGPPDSAALAGGFLKKWQREMATN